MGIIISIFGVGANVSRIKDKNSANNGVIYGTTISVVLFGLIAFNCSDYIKFMNLNKKRS